MDKKLDKQSEKPNPAADAQDAPDSSQLLRSEDLLQGRSYVRIKHGEDTYCLRLTSAGKLYLTK
jgi:hemin uptake protein HemP